MKPTPWFTASALVLLAALSTIPLACDNAPQRSFHAALESYNAAMRTLIALDDAGRLPAVARPRIELIRAAAWDALLRWEAALESGAPAHAYIGAFNQALDRLIQELARYE